MLKNRLTYLFNFLFLFVNSRNCDRSEFAKFFSVLFHHDLGSKIKNSYMHVITANVQLATR